MTLRKGKPVDPYDIVSRRAVKRVVAAKTAVKTGQITVATAHAAKTWRIVTIPAAVLLWTWWQYGRTTAIILVVAAAVILVPLFVWRPNGIVGRIIDHEANRRFARRIYDQWPVYLEHAGVISPSSGKTLKPVRAHTGEALVEYHPAGFRVPLRLPLGMTGKIVDGYREQIRMALAQFHSVDVRQVALSEAGRADRVWVDVRTLDPLADPAATMTVRTIPGVPVVDETGEPLPEPEVTAVTDDQEPLDLPVPNQHILIGGVTGSGKSGWLNNVLAKLAPLPNVAIIGIDPKAVELTQWKPRLSGLALSGEMTEHFLTVVLNEIQVRKALLARAGKRNIGEGSPDMPHIVVVVDELREVVQPDPLEKVADRKAAKAAADHRSDLLDSIACLGRSFGVWLVCATQYPLAEVVGSTLRMQLTCRVVLKVNTRVEADVIAGTGRLDGFDNPPWEWSSADAGRAIVIGATGRPIEARSIWRNENRIATIANRFAHRRVDLSHLTDRAGQTIAVAD